MSEHAADVVLKIGGTNPLRRVIHERTAKLSREAANRPSIVKCIALEDDNGGIEVIEYNEVETIVEKHSEEVVAKFAKAIEMAYGSALHASMQTARNMLVEPELMAKVLPKIVKHLAGAAKMVDRDNGIEKSGDFDSAVAAIKKRDGCSNVAALRKARVEHPELFAAYQTA